MKYENISAWYKKKLSLHQKQERGTTREKPHKCEAIGRKWGIPV